MDEIVFISTTEMVRKIKDKEISCKEIMQAHLQQIKKINPKVNAIVMLVDEEKLLTVAEEADQQIAHRKKLEFYMGCRLLTKI